MLGIRGLDPFGAFHAGLGLMAIVLGFCVLILQKGTALHRRIGMAYLVSMVALNVTALAIYDLFGQWGPFHNLALVSLLTVTAGVVPVWVRRPRGRWMRLHATCMAWSFAGVLAAFFSELGARIPGVGLVAGVIWPTAAVMLAAAILIHTRVPRTVGRLAAPAANMEALS